MSASLIESFSASTLRWLPELGIGWYPVTEQSYDEGYWRRYRAMDETPVGGALTALRRQLVERFHAGSAVDIGIGGGRFVVERPQTLGFDVNPAAVAWLKETGRWCDPYQETVEAACFWDSLEHIHDPAPLLANVRRWLFVSLPIFQDVEHLLRSKHYRKDEHCWYCTRAGFERFMAAFGFEVVYSDEREQQAGREDIGTFVLQRVADA